MLSIESLCGGYKNVKTDKKDKIAKNNKKYKKDKKDNNVIFDISLSLERGEVISVVGRNGSGKSTLLRTILGMAERTGGNIMVDGVNIEDMSRREIACSIGYLAQGREVADMTVGELVLHGRFPHSAAMSPYSEHDRAIAFECILKMGLSEYTDTAIQELSGGMRQKAYLAMVLCQQTEYIFLDEPTTYLDISHQIELMRLLRELAHDIPDYNGIVHDSLDSNGIARGDSERSRRGILCVMHDIPLALEYSDKVAVIDRGRLVAFDTPSAVCESGILRSALGVGVTYDGRRYVYDL